ncbi:MAPEG family protein [Chelatococcus sambhunathii]|uniref:MAPEG family protein n=1 Tax=Chelatococcus sambhunathii TaxID=363953 RepID=A0ABU1DAW1_9HYPH|nr:MAPEG family protein [Chelatococcus sambhunathii]MDR4305060.1 MAPEG family protein [Chelatococcus sambhunathii]
MSVQMILAPVFVLVLLAVVLAVWMGRSRFAALRAGQIKVGPGSPRNADWPEPARKVSDCFHNQLELPLYFYVVAILALVTRQADLAFVVLSWLFVALRYLHAFEHTGRNRLKARFGLFASGALVLLALWLYLALKIYTLA